MKCPIIAFAAALLAVSASNAIADDRADLKRRPQTSIELLKQAVNTSNRANALALINKAIELDPRFPYAYTARATLLQADGHIKEAIADLTKALDLNPSIDDAWLLRAELREQQGDLVGAKSDRKAAADARSKGDHNLTLLDSLVEKNRKDAKPYLERAQYKTLKRNPDYKSATQDFEKYLSIVKKPKNPHVYWLLSSAYKNAGELEKAVNACSRGIATFDREHVDNLYQRRSQYLSKLGRKTEANRDRETLKQLARQKKESYARKRVEGCSETLSTHPDLGSSQILNVLLSRAVAYVDLGELDNAQSDVSRARGIDDKNMHVHRTQHLIDKAIEKASK